MKNVQEVNADRAGDPVRAQNAPFSVTLEADRTQAEIVELIHHPDRIAEIPNSRRLGTEVKLADVKAVEIR